MRAIALSAAGFVSSHKSLFFALTVAPVLVILSDNNTAPSGFSLIKAQQGKNATGPTRTEQHSQILKNSHLKD